MPSTVKTIGECFVSVSVSSACRILIILASQFEVRGPPGVLKVDPKGHQTKIKILKVDLEAVSSYLLSGAVDHIQVYVKCKLYHFIM